MSGLISKVDESLLQLGTLNHIDPRLTADRSQPKRDWVGENSLHISSGPKCRSAGFRGAWCLDALVPGPRWLARWEAPHQGEVF